MDIELDKYPLIAEIELYIEWPVLTIKLENLFLTAFEMHYHCTTLNLSGVATMEKIWGDFSS